MKTFLKIFVIVTIAVLFYTCSSSYNEKRTSEYNAVADSNLYAWVNLMPGGKPRFHIAGDLLIRENGNVIPDSVELRKVAVLQNEKVFYHFRPVINNKFMKPDENNSDIKRNIHFTDGQGFDINPGFNSDQPIKLQFHLYYNNEPHIYNSKEIKVEKVY